MGQVRERGQKYEGIPSYDLRWAKIEDVFAHEKYARMLLKYLFAHKVEKSMYGLKYREATGNDCPASDSLDWVVKEEM